MHDDPFDQDSFRYRPDLRIERRGPWVLVDLDSTLCDTRHRHHLIKTGDERRFTDWDAYSLACADDTPIEGTVRLLHMLAPTHNICYLSGRSYLAMDLTVEWFRQNNILWHAIKLRPPAQNKLGNALYKQDFAKKARALEGWRIKLMIDDWEPVAAEMSKIGVPTLLVQPPLAEPHHAEAVASGGI